jgi:hypothetical protein
MRHNRKRYSLRLPIIKSGLEIDIENKNITPNELTPYGLSINHQELPENLKIIEKAT